MSFEVGYICKLPILFTDTATRQDIDLLVSENIRISKQNWDSYETSWDFDTHPLIKFYVQGSHISNLKTSFEAWSTFEERNFNKQKFNEEKINHIFISIYGLQKLLQDHVNKKDITLLKPDLNRDLRSFISYSVGCMFGRYSLDKPGLILSNQGETAQDYYKQISLLSFPPDEDNVLPILEAGWFNDDITERFKKFLRVTFGDEHYEENLAFIENAIGRDIRSYFLKDFYVEHVQMYKKRPIYWLFSSPNGSFNALVYMHRYRSDTVSVVLNDYLREYVRKLNAHKAHLEQVSLRLGGSQAEKTKALKEINALNKVLAELKEYEDQVLYPLATRQLQIDLDDGVRVNYNKFGKALKWVKGLSE